MAVFHSHKRPKILLGTLFIICITASFCTPVADQPPQSTTTSPDELNSATPLNYERTGTVQVLLTYAAEVQTQAVVVTTTSPDFDPGTATAQAIIDNSHVIGQTEDMIVYSSKYEMIDNTISEYLIYNNKLCVWSGEFGYKELTPDFPEIYNSFSKAAISNNEQLISYYYSDYSVLKGEGGLIEPTAISLFIHDLGSGENIEIMTEKSPPTFFNDIYQAVWINNDRQLLFLFPEYIEHKDEATGITTHDSVNRVFIYDLENKTLDKIIECEYIGKAIYLQSANKVIFTHPTYIDILDLDTMETRQTIEFEWIYVPTDYIDSPLVTFNPVSENYYVAVPKDVVYGSQATLNVYFYEINGISGDVRELAVMEDISYTNEPLIISPDGTWLIYNQKLIRSPIYYINTITGETLTRDITKKEYRKMQYTSYTPTPDFGSPWMAGCPPTQ